MSLDAEAFCRAGLALESLPGSRELRKGVSISISSVSLEKHREIPIFYRDDELTMIETPPNSSSFLTLKALLEEVNEHDTA